MFVEHACQAGLAVAAAIVGVVVVSTAIALVALLFTVGVF